MLFWNEHNGGAFRKSDYRLQCNRNSFSGAKIRSGSGVPFSPGLLRNPFFKADEKTLMRSYRAPSRQHTGCRASEFPFMPMRELSFESSRR